MFTNRPLTGGPPGFSEGVLMAEAGVVGVRNPLTGLLLGGWDKVGVTDEAMLLIERFNFVGDITLLVGYKNILFSISGALNFVKCLTC